MKNKHLIIFFFLCINISCTPKLKILSGIKIIHENQSREVYVFGKSDTLPVVADFLGRIETKGNFFTSGKYKVNESIELIKKGAIQLNGNAIKIEEIKFPGPIKSKSYDISAQVLHLKNIPERNYRLVKETNNDESKYIILYRPKRILGSGISYPIYLFNSFLCGLDNGNKIIIELPANSTENYYVQIESYGELYKIPILFRNSNKIYLKCTVNFGGIPKVSITEQ